MPPVSVPGGATGRSPGRAGRAGVALPSGSRDSIERGSIHRWKQTTNGPVIMPLCNFTARIREEVILDDGVETTRAWVVEGKLADGGALPPIRVPVQRFPSMTWVLEQWGLRAVVHAGQANRDYLREA